MNEHNTKVKHVSFKKSVNNISGETSYNPQGTAQCM